MAGSWQLDARRSTVEFSVRHLMVSTVRGRFNHFDVRLDGDPRDFANASIAVTIQAASVDTNEKERDAHLRGEDFFAVDTFPSIIFKSQRIQPVGHNQFDIEGELTVRDVTKPVTLKVAYGGEVHEPGGPKRTVFQGELKLSRKELGLTWNVALEAGGVMVSDEVTVTISAQFSTRA